MSLDATTIGIIIQLISVGIALGIFKGKFDRFEDKFNDMKEAINELRSRQEKYFNLSERITVLEIKIKDYENGSV